MKQVAIVDFGSTKIQCILASAGREGTLQIEGQVAERHSGLKKNHQPNIVLIQKSTLDAMEELEKQTRTDIGPVCIGVPGLYSKAICCRAKAYYETPHILQEEDMQELTRKSLEDTQRQQMILLHSIPVYYILDGEKYYELPERKAAQSIEIIFSHVFMMREFRELVHTVLDGSKYKVLRFVASTFAQALYVIPEEALARDAILVDVGGYETNVCIMRSHAPVFHQTFPIGGEHLSNDLKYVTKMNSENAEIIKKRYIFGLAYDEGNENVRLENGRLMAVPNQLIQDIMEARAAEMIIMIANYISESPIDLAEGTSISLTGGGLAPIRGSVEFFQKFVGFPVRSQTPVINHIPAPFGVSSALGVAQYVLADEEELGKPTWKERSFFKKLLHFFME